MVKDSYPATSQNEHLDTLSCTLAEEIQCPIYSTVVIISQVSYSPRIWLILSGAISDAFDSEDLLPVTFMKHTQHATNFISS